MRRFHRSNGLLLFVLLLVQPCRAQDRGAVVSASAEAAIASTAVPGTLLLCGGGPLPNSVLELFFTHGRGEEGKLVIIPTASRLADAGDNSFALGTWSQFKWASVDILHAFDRAQAEVEDFANTLKSATAVWISGGDQRRLAERYQGTAVETEIRNVMMRGGVVGGTSAGSAIATRVMISGGQTQPQLANGLDLLPNAIIDQHFSQRKRFERLASAVADHPDRMGIGIDESTGLLVNDKRAQVVGAGAVYVYANSNRAMKIVRLNDAQEDGLPANVAPEVERLPVRPLRIASGDAMESEEFPLLRR